MYNAKDVARAKELERIQVNLLAKFRKAERERESTDSLMMPPPPPSQPRPLVPVQVEKPLTLAKAKKLEILEKSVRDRFASVQKRKADEMLEHERRYEPITRVISSSVQKQQEQQQRKQEQQQEETTPQDVKKFSRRKISKRVTSTPMTSSHLFHHNHHHEHDPYYTTTTSTPTFGTTTTTDDEEEADTVDEDEEFERRSSVKQSPKGEEEVTTEGEETERFAASEQIIKQNESVKQMMESNILNLGPIAGSYILSLKDKPFGIYLDEDTRKFFIGAEPIDFAGDDIIVKGKKYRGTRGLWTLLTTDKAPKRGSYTDTDYESFKELMRVTNSLYQRNDPSTRRVKSSTSTKYRRFIKPIWDKYYKKADKRLTAQQSQPSSSSPSSGVVAAAAAVEGSGLKRYNDGPVEYRYINNLSELVKRLQFIAGQEEAGNNSFHNEKLSVVRFLHDRMEELIDTPGGLKYVVRCLSAMPEHVIRGSGLFNDIINKLPFEMHAPRNWRLDETYNYCGPGTKLDERLARGDPGVNPLDEACKEHDVWYGKYRLPEDRRVADKILQEKAWRRVTAPDADTNERLVGLATTGGMWLKRKLGMGLGTSAVLYPSTTFTDNNTSAD